MMAEQNPLIHTTPSASIEKTQQRAFSKTTRGALAAVAILGLTNCGGEEPVAVQEPEPVVEDPSDGFIEATDDEPDEEAPESLAYGDDAGGEPEPSEQVDPAEEGGAPDSGTDVDEPASGIDSPPSPPGATGNYVVLRTGQLFLRGTMPSEELAAAAVSSLEPLIGPGNVIDEYDIDPDSVYDPSRASTVYIADTVLFNTGSAQISDDFAPLLSLGPLLLQIQPNATLEIVGHTDAQGSEEANLALSEERVNAVRNWIVERGGDPDRVIATGAGESQPVADNNTEEGRAINRRVEFVVEGFEIST